MKKRYVINVKKYNDFGTLKSNENVFESDNLIESFKKIQKLSIEEENKLADELGGFRFRTKTSDLNRDFGKIGYLVHNEENDLNCVHLTLVDANDNNRQITIEEVEKCFPNNSTELRCSDCYYYLLYCHKIITPREAEDYGGCCEKCHKYYAN